MTDKMDNHITLNTEIPKLLGEKVNWWDGEIFL